MSIESAHYDMDTNKMFVLQQARYLVAIDCTAVENMVAENLYQRSELDYLLWNDPVAYADLILNGDPKKYLRAVTVCRPDELK